jgi:hypothetical protein
MEAQWSQEQRYAIVAFMDAIVYCHDAEGIERIFSTIVGYAFADDPKMCSTIAQLEAELD